MPRRFVVGLAFALAVLAPAAASAENEPAPKADPSSPAAQAEARQAMERGIAARDKGDHETAIAEYKKAIDLVPEANVPHRFMAESLAALRRWDEAVTSWETYLRIKPNVQDAPHVRARIDEVRAKYIEGVVDVDCTPEGSAVTLDPGDVLTSSAPAGVTPLRDLHVRAGAHTVLVQKQGYKEARISVPVTAGASRVVQCALEKEGGGGATGFVPTPQDSRRSDDKGGGGGFFGSAWFWAGLGIVVAGGVVTAIVIASRPSSDGPPRTDGGTLRF